LNGSAHPADGSGATDNWWFWLGGPERGKVFFKDNPVSPYTGGTTMAGYYSNWNTNALNPAPNNVEPNGSFAGEDYLQMVDTDAWNDLNGTQSLASFIEYGGSSTDSVSSVRIKVIGPNAFLNAFPCLNNLYGNVPMFDSVLLREWRLL
jgi:hypothetical protein